MSKKFIFALSATLVVVVAIVVVFAFALGRTQATQRASGSVITADKGAEDPYCLLVAGKDRASGLTDVLMLVSFDPQKSRISVMQIPRDTYAEYGRSGHRKLNGALGALGSPEALKNYFESSLGVDIDGYLTLDLDGFRKIVDAVGGVQIELDAPIYYKDPLQKLNISLEKGKQTLNGRQAEMFVRYRSGYANGDIGRLDAQKKFLAAFFRTLKNNINAKNAYKLAESLIDAVDTDVNLALAVMLGLEALGTESDSLLFFTMPGEAIVSARTGASFYVMSATATDRLLREYFGKNGEGIDSERLFAHPDYEDFIRIYESDVDILPTRADGIG